VAIDVRAETYQRLVAGAAMDAATEGSLAVASMLKAAGIAVSDTLLSDYTLAQLEAMVFTASDATVARLTGNINAALIDAYSSGLGIEEAGRVLRDGVFENMRTYEATRVARTEINGAQNWGSFQTIRDYGQYAEWWTALDARVRTYYSTGGLADHMLLHGQIVRIGDKFSNGLMYPGDRAGRIAEWISCRCRLLPFMMPMGYTAPIGVPYFTRAELIRVT